MAAKKKPAAPPKKSPAKASAKATVSGSRSGTAAARDQDAAARKMADTQDLAAAFPHNAAKPAEHGEMALDPPEGQHEKPADPATTGASSRISTANRSTARMPT